MLRRISKLGFLIQFVLFLALAFILWLPTFVHPVVPMHIASEGPLYNLLTIWLIKMPFLSVCLAFALVLSLSFFLYIIGSVNDLVARENFLPAIFLLFLLSWNERLLVLHPLLPAGLLILLSIQTIMGMYGQQEPYRQAFTASASIGMASLFYLPAAYLILMLWFSFITYRIGSWREWIISLIGFLLPFVYLLSWLFWNDNFRIGVLSIITSINNPGIGMYNLKPIEISWLLASALVLIITLTSVLNVIQDKLISLRRKSFIMINFSIACVFMVLLSGSPVFYSHQLFFLPLAFFMAASLSLIKKRLFLEIFLLLFIAFIVIIRVIL